MRRAASLLGAFAAACSAQVVPPGDGGAGGMAVGGSGGAPASCPTGEGWPMVLVPLADGRSFCIDSRETTNDHYAAFLSKGNATQHPQCGGNVDLVPAEGWPPAPGQGTYPVRAVNWCDAYAYCDSVGKRLCGDLDGKIIELEERFDSTKFAKEVSTEMQAACTRNGERKFAYGDVGEIGRCPDDAFAPERLIAADATTSCEGGYPGIFFLQGNALELMGACKWETTNEGLDGARCYVMGASGCEPREIYVDGATGELDWLPTTGIRCCADSISGT